MVLQDIFNIGRIVIKTDCVKKGAFRMRWTSSKYLMAVGKLRVEAQNEGQIYESDILDKATDFLKENMELKKYLEMQGHWDAVRKVANDIGYEGGY